MEQIWPEYQEAAKKGPGPILWKVGGLLLAVVLVVWGVGYLLGWFGEAADVAKKEFGPKAALGKYEWFINQAANVDKAKKDVDIFENNLKRLDDQYVAAYGWEKRKWPPDVRVLYNSEMDKARTDLIAVASNYNALVRDYNAQSQKFNWHPFQTDPRKPKEKYFEYTTPGSS